MNQPLFGKRIVVTRARVQASQLSEPLRALGAEVIELPTIQIVAPADQYAALDAAIAQVKRYDWIIFTSRNGVAHFWQRLGQAGHDKAALKHLRVAAVGSATAQALKDRGIMPQIVPKRFVAESLLEALFETNITNQRFLLPRADIARPTLPKKLIAAGAQVDDIDTYRTIAAQPDANALAELDKGVDIITFTSSSTVRNFVKQVGSERIKKLTQQAMIAAIGPITARTAQDLDLHVDIMPTKYTIAGLIEAIVGRKLCHLILHP